MDFLFVCLFLLYVCVCSNRICLYQREACSMVQPTMCVPWLSPDGDLLAHIAVPFWPVLLSLAPLKTKRIYTVTKSKKYNNDFFNGTEPCIFILFLEEVLRNIFFYRTYIYSKPCFLGFFQYVKKQYRMRTSTSLQFYPEFFLSETKIFSSL